LVFYKEEGDIVVRTCGNRYSEVETQSDCIQKGSENRVPVRVFKKMLQTEFLIGDADKFLPMTKEEIEEYRKRNSKTPNVETTEKLRAQEALLNAKLARVEEFLAGNAVREGERELIRAQLKAVGEELAKGETRGPAAKKVNYLINEIVDKIADSSTLYKVGEEREGNRAMFRLLRQFDAGKGQCGTDAIISGSKDYNPGDHDRAPRGGGLKGAWLWTAIFPEARAETYTVEDRIKNCISLPGAVQEPVPGVKWHLVARTRDEKTGRYYEVWQDSQTKLLWGDRLDKTFAHHEAIVLGSNCRKVRPANPNESDSKACNVILETACTSEEGIKANAGLGGVTFGLPTIHDIRLARRHGMERVLPNLEGATFWSASLKDHLIGKDEAYLFTHSAGTYYSSPKERFSVRCVGR
jgi:hypothetical protein